MSPTLKPAILLAGAFLSSAVYVIVTRSSWTNSSASALPQLQVKATGVRIKPLFRVNELATLLVHNRIDTGLGADSQFVLRSFTPDNAQLLVERKEVSERQVEGGHQLNIFFDLVDLNNGNIKSLLRNRSDIDVRFGNMGSLAAPLAFSDASAKDKNAPFLFFDPLVKAPPTATKTKITSGALSGRAVSVDEVRLAGTGNNTRWGTFVSLFRFGSGATPQSQSFPVESNGFDVFGPQWSPDGQTVLLKVGSQGDETDTYSLYFWNPQLGRIKRGPREPIAYLKPRWSPDSARIAYLTGGDSNGNNGFLARQPTSLCVYDVAKRKSRRLVTGLSGSEVSLSQFQWRDAKSLLYAAWTPNLLQSRRDSVPGVDDGSARPDIWEVTATGDASKLVVEAAFRPMPSPDQRWIAFFGWIAGNEKISAGARPRLFLWDCQTHRRILVQPDVFREGAQMMWTPDSQKLVLLRSSYKASVAQGIGCLGTVSVE